MLDFDESNWAETGLPCGNCGSSDAKAINKDGSSKCFSCGKFTPASAYQRKAESEDYQSNVVPMPTKGVTMDGVFAALSDRSIKAETAKLYGVQVKYGADGEISNHMYPYYKDGALVAKKVRNVKEKSFHAEGNIRNSELFGQHLPVNGKMVTITEGECDAMAAYELLGSKFPVVSVVNGAAAAPKDIKRNLEYFDQFESIVICFDNDKAGNEAAQKVAELFAPGRAKICKLSKHKDANEYLRNNQRQDFSNDWWGAKTFTPDGIVAGNDLWDVVTAEVKQSYINYPWDGMNELTYGIRTHELITVAAGSGMGKSQFLRELIYYLLKNTEDNIGLLMMEESIRRTGLSIMSMDANQLLHLPDTVVSNDDLRKHYDNTLGTGRLFLYDSFGSNTIDNIISRVRYMAKGLDCKYIFLDHISIIVSDQQHGDERRALDEISTKLRTLVQETGVALFMVSHLKRPPGTSHEEGGATSLSQLRGSAGIGQLSDIVIGLERNGQHEDEEIRNTTTVRVLKNRFSGLTGPATYLKYSKYTGRMTETEAPETGGSDDQDEF